MPNKSAIDCPDLKEGAVGYVILSIAACRSLAIGVVAGIGTAGDGEAGIPEDGAVGDGVVLAG